MMSLISPTVETAIAEFLEVYISKGAHRTAKAYQFALTKWSEVLTKSGISMDSAIDGLDFEELTTDFVIFLQEDHLSAATEKLYFSALIRFLAHLESMEYADTSFMKVSDSLRHYSQQEEANVKTIDLEAIEQFLLFMEHLTPPVEALHREILSTLRDKALIFVLAQCGLRIEEACRLTTGQILWRDGYATISNNRGLESIAYFSPKALKYVKDYLEARRSETKTFDEKNVLAPLFARYDAAAGRKTLPISTTTGRNIVGRWVKEAGLRNSVGMITPQSLREYFIIKTYLSTGDLAVTTRLARNESILTTERYIVNNGLLPNPRDS